MAVQLESQNQLLELVDMLKRRVWWIVLPAALVIAAGSVVAVFLPKKYTVMAQVKIQEVRVDDPGRLAITPKGTATQREIQNAQYQVLQSDRIIKILKDFDWQDYREKDEAGRWEYTKRIQRNIKVDVLAKQKDEGSTYIDIQYKDTDPTRAETFLNELALRWQRELQQSDIENLTSDLLTLKTLREEAEAKLGSKEKQISNIQQELELYPVIGTESGRLEDPLQSRRSKLEIQRDASVQSLAALGILLADLAADYAAEPATLPSPTLDPANVVAGPAGKIDEAILLLKIELDKLKPGNTKYRQTSDDIRSLEQQREQLLSKVEEQLPSVRAVPNQYKESLRIQIDSAEREQRSLAKKVELLESQISDLTEKLRRRTDGQANLRELEQERDALQLAAQRNAEKEQSTQFNLRLLTNRAEPYLIVEPARAEKRPSEPNVLVIMAFVVIAGLGVGLGLALLVEFSQPGFRSPGEAVRGLSVPVLGIVDRITTAADRRRAWINRIVVGTSSLVVIGGLSWFAWAWSSARDLLGTDLVLWLTDLEDKLK